MGLRPRPSSPSGASLCTGTPVWRLPSCGANSQLPATAAAVALSSLAPGAGGAEGRSWKKGPATRTRARAARPMATP
eukprot:251443-Lingulodinium_polyedra.AAC.1